MQNACHKPSILLCSLNSMVCVTTSVLPPIHGRVFVSDCPHDTVQQLNSENGTREDHPPLFPQPCQGYRVLRADRDALEWTGAPVRRELSALSVGCGLDTEHKVQLTKSVRLWGRNANILEVVLLCQCVPSRSAEHLLCSRGREPSGEPMGTSLRGG